MIICCGEALIDMIPSRTEAGEAAFVPHCGGAVYNTAIALGRLGAEVAMISGVSTDLFGAQLAEGLAASGVATDLLVRSDRNTTMAYVALKDGKASYVFHDENSAGRMVAPADLPPLPAACKALYFGGISLAVEPGADTYAGLCATHAPQLPVMIDPNIRPGFIQDEAAFRARIEAMIQAADIVKISDEDLDWLSPGDAALEDKARGLGAALVVLTRGAEGAQAIRADGSAVSVPAHKAQVVDTVGAGDTFNAGFLFRLDELGCLDKQKLATIPDTALAAALDFGARVAAVTVSRAGANPPWREELPA